jgi:hypothetical protein
VSIVPVSSIMWRYFNFNFLPTISNIAQLGDGGAPAMTCRALVKVAASSAGTAKRTRLLLLVLQWRRWWVMRQKLCVNPKFLTRQRCEHVEFRLYLGGWQFLKT